MAKLGDITIKTAEYRPCYVREFEHSDNWKLCKEEARKRERKALFHRWGLKAKALIKSSDGSLSTPFEITLAIVEYEDGQIAEVPPDAVRFVPGLMNEYDFREAVMNETGNDADPGE